MQAFIAEKVSMPSPEYDLVFIRAGIQVLQEYLLSQEIYWAIGVSPPAGEAPYPQLTLGGLLISRARLRARPCPPELQLEQNSLEDRLNSIQKQWRVAWEKKASREFHSRLALWRNFIEDFRSDPENHFDRYTFEISRRVILHLLAPYATNLQPAEFELLNGLDQFLRAVLIPSEFIWEAELANGFPPQVYWYLYGKVRA